MLQALPSAELVSVARRHKDSAVAQFARASMVRSPADIAITATSMARNRSLPIRTTPVDTTSASPRGREQQSAVGDRYHLQRHDQVADRKPPEEPDRGTDAQFTWQPLVSDQKSRRGEHQPEPHGAQRDLEACRSLERDRVRDLTVCWSDHRRELHVKTVRPEGRA